MASIIQIRRDTSSNWTSANPTLAQGEIGIETGSLRLKIGDGSSAWGLLPYYSTGTAAAVWGGISGDLLDQGDLIAALDLKGDKVQLDRLTWLDLINSWTEEPILNATISGGEVYDYVFGATEYYRYVPTAYDSALDQFWSGFNGTTLTGLIATRGISI